VELSLAKLVVLLSGGITSGKTTLSNGLHSRFGAQIVKAKDVIRELAAKRLGRDLDPERRAMQQFGDKLDRETKGSWVWDALRRFVSHTTDDAVVLADSVRILDQIRAIRQERCTPEDVLGLHPTPCVLLESARTVPVDKRKLLSHFRTTPRRFQGL
jgi:adenylate kinase family enzyme